MDETVQYLRNEYEDVNRQWLENEARREAELNKQIGFLNQQDKRDMDPMLAAGIGGIYGRDPFQEYQRARLPGIQREGTRRSLTNEHLASKEKSLADLREKVMARMNAAKSAAAANASPYHFMPMGGNVFVGNKGTGQMAVIASDKVDEWRKQFDQFLAIYEKQGGKTVEEMKRQAFDDTASLMGSLTKGAQNFGGVADARTGDPVPTAPVVAPSIGGTQPAKVIQDPNNPFTSEQLAAIEQDAKGQGLSPQTPVNAPPGFKVPATAEKLSVADTDSGVYVPTPEQKTLAGKQYEGYAKQHEDDLAAVAALRNQAPSINVMKSVLSNPNVKYMSGPLHEELVAVSGFMNYLDPDSSIVKVGDTIPSYFSNMMNLVRDKIKALGAGTAVSNLDLIVTQKSVGDLRNNPEGNKKLLAIMELQNAVLNDRLQRKIGYFEGNRDGYKGYEGFAKKFGSEPTHMITRNQNTGDYRVISKEDWMKQGEAVLKNAGKPVTPENLNRLWKREADYSVAAMLKGTGVTYQGKKQ
jgi:hypothetical protein